MRRLGPRGGGWRGLCSGSDRLSGLAAVVDRSAPVGCTDLRLWRLLPPESVELALSPVTPLGRCAAVKAGRSDRAQAKRIAHSDAVLGVADMAVSATERPLNLDVLTPAFEWSACETRIHSIGGCNGGKRLSQGGSTGCHHPWPTFAPDEFRNAVGLRTGSKRWSGSRRSCCGTDFLDAAPARPNANVARPSLRRRRHQPSHSNLCPAPRPPTSPVRCTPVSFSEFESTHLCTAGRNSGRPDRPGGLYPFWWV